MSKYQNEVCDYGVPSEIAVIQKERVLSEHGLLAERVSAAARLITTTENQERVLFLRKRGFGGDTATYTDLAGALMMPRSSLRGLLQTLPEGIVPDPLCAQEKEWYQAETSEVERVVKNDSQIKIITEWVNGYQIQQVSIDIESNKEECDVRVLGFGDLRAQAQFETAVEMSGRWNETLMLEIDQELDDEIVELVRRGGKLLSSATATRWHKARSAELALLRVMTSHSIVSAKPTITFVPYCRISGKTGEKTHSLDAQITTRLSSTVVDTLLQSGIAHKLSFEELIGDSPSQPAITSPVLVVPNRDLVLFGRSVGLAASEDVCTQSLFGDSDRSAQLCLSSQLFV